MKVENLIINFLEKSKKVISDTLESDNFRQSIIKASELIIETYNNKGKVILAGNGGSASDCQHVCAEFIGRFNFDRPSLPAIALTANSSNLTCISNDYGYKNVFSRQIIAHGEPNDTLIVYTTSGKSENIIELVNAASKTKKYNCFDRNKYKSISENCDVIISVNSDDTPKIQEVHAIAGHMICESVDTYYLETHR